MMPTRQIYLNNELDKMVQHEAAKIKFLDDRSRPSPSKVIQAALKKYFGGKKMKKKTKRKVKELTDKEWDEYADKMVG